ncbi:hypothetical protein AB0E00_35925 [Streptomyces sp. NPDC048110]|uniref:hypothetical protein n=1 Tax=Streptomyces sp. NPDC048110 TaxID=3155483 RepID=UPI0033F453B4
MKHRVSVVTDAVGGVSLPCSSLVVVLKLLTRTVSPDPAAWIQLASGIRCMSEGTKVSGG